MGEARGMAELEFALIGSGGGAIGPETGFREEEEEADGGGGGGTIQDGAGGPVGRAGRESEVMQGSTAGFGELGVGSNLIMTDD